MVTLLVTVGREIQFTSSPDLPAGFRRAIAADNTFPNPLHGKRKGFPATVEAYYHNPYTKEVALPRGYWPQLVARAEEFGVHLVATEEREEQPAVISRTVAVPLQDLRFGMETLQALIDVAIPVSWEMVNIQITVTRHKAAPPVPEEPDRQPEKLTHKPFPWEADQDG